MICSTRASQYTKSGVRVVPLNKGLQILEEIDDDS